MRKSLFEAVKELGEAYAKDSAMESQQGRFERAQTYAHVASTIYRLLERHASPEEKGS